MDKIEFLWKTIQRYDAYIAETNSKAAFLIAWNTFLFGTVVVKGQEFTTSMGPLPWVRAATETILIIIAVVSLVSLWLTFRVVNPFLKSPSKLLTYHSLVYFGHVAQFNEDEYRDLINTRSEEYILGDLAYQANVLARGLVSKFALLKMAIAAIVYGQIPLLIIAIVMFVLRRVISQ